MAHDTAPMFGSRLAALPALWRSRWVGPALTVGAVVAIMVGRTVVTISSPGLILLVLVALSAVLGGIRPALASATIASAFVVVDASAPGQLFQYDSVAQSRLLVNVATTFVMAALVGGIQERLEAQRELLAAKRSEDRQRALTDPASEAILTIDVGSRIFAANPATAELFGYPIDQIVGGSITRLIPPAMRDRHLAAMEHYLATGRRTIPWHGAELQAMDASGREFPVEVSLGEYGKGADRRFTGIVRDISRRKEVEAQLMQAQKMDAIGRLAGGVAHDFNNLLTAIGGYAELVASTFDPSDPRQAHVTGIRQATEHAASLTRQLLTFSRGQELTPSVVSLSQVVTTVEPMLRRLLGEQIELVVKADPDAWLTVADRSQVEAILVNLVVNARDAMVDGGTLTIETGNVELDERYRLHHAEVKPGEYAMVIVTDTGTGMDAATMAHIFEPFFTTKDARSGTGLGLATVYGTVKQSGGYVWVYSEPGQGSTFKIYLPRANRPGDADLEPSGSAMQARPQHATVLVAEDEAVVREMVVAALERLGYRVMAASTGEEAVRLIDRLGDEIDLLLSDVVMPGMSGPDLLDRARRTRPELRAIFMSGYTALTIGRPIQPGVTLLEKPFSGARLGEAVREMLAGGSGGMSGSGRTAGLGATGSSGGTAGLGATDATGGTTGSGD
ncbi:MAG TPA: PAS domain S-box protein [Candidatus Limnocylindrales bacterium]